MTFNLADDFLNNPFGKTGIEMFINSHVNY
jgi:hypothetical protein